MTKTSLDKSERTKLARIRDVYDSFQVNPEYSKKLVGSNIFFLIKAVYETALNNKGESPTSFYHYNEFIREADRLIEVWDKQRLN